MAQDYQEFVDKFKPKKTTDDCYTPPIIYDTVLAWVEKEYGIDRAQVIRPFKPNGDYQSEDYTGRVVVDNPPFSCLAAIIDWYNERNIKYFLFAPSLTALEYSNRTGICCVFTNSQIVYENGAHVRTAFLTNMDDCIARSACDLSRGLDEANKQVEKEKAYGRTQNRKGTVAKYNYPDEPVTSARLTNLAAKGVNFKLKRGHFVRRLDAQKPIKKSIFGAGLLISTQDAQKLKAEETRVKEEKERELELSKLKAQGARLQDGVIHLELSEREQTIIDNL